MSLLGLAERGVRGLLGRHLLDCCGVSSKHHHDEDTNVGMSKNRTKSEESRAAGLGPETSWGRGTRYPHWLRRIDKHQGSR